MFFFSSEFSFSFFLFIIFSNSAFFHFVLIPPLLSYFFLIMFYFYTLIPRDLTFISFAFSVFTIHPFSIFDLFLFLLSFLCFLCFICLTLLYFNTLSLLIWGASLLYAHPTTSLRAVCSRSTPLFGHWLPWIWPLQTGSRTNQSRLQAPPPAGRHRLPH